MQYIRSCALLYRSKETRKEIYRYRFWLQVNGFVKNENSLQKVMKLGSAFSVKNLQVILAIIHSSNRTEQINLFRIGRSATSGPTFLLYYFLLFGDWPNIFLLESLRNIFPTIYFCEACFKCINQGEFSNIELSSRYYFQNTILQRRTLKTCKTVILK